MSPTISSPVCQEQLIEAGKLVDRSVESCVQACLSATEDGELLKQVSLINEYSHGALNSDCSMYHFCFFVLADSKVYHKSDFKHANNSSKLVDCFVS